MKYERDELNRRLCLIQDQYSKSVSQFAKMIGKNQVTVNNYMTGSRDVSIDFLVDLLYAFPDVSAEWLLRGNGEMLKSGAVQEQHDVQTSESDRTQELIACNQELTRQNMELVSKYKDLVDKFVNAMLSGNRVE